LDLGWHLLLFGFSVYLVAGPCHFWFGTLLMKLFFWGLLIAFLTYVIFMIGCMVAITSLVLFGFGGMVLGGLLIITSIFYMLYKEVYDKNDKE
jgi:hypothetical protein